MRASEYEYAQLERFEYILGLKYAEEIAALNDIDPIDVREGNELMTVPRASDYYLTGDNSLQQVFMGANHVVMIYHPVPTKLDRRKSGDGNEGIDLVGTTVMVEHFFRAPVGWSSEHKRHLVRNEREMVQAEVTYKMALRYKGAQLEALLKHAPDGLSINELWQAPAAQRTFNAEGIGYLGYARTQFTVKTNVIVPKGRYTTPNP